MAYSATISISVSPGRIYKITSTASMDAYYSGVKVFGSGAVAYFVANESTSLVVQSSSALTGSVNVVEVLRAFYDANDSQGGTWVYQPYLKKWVSLFSFIPESMSMASNRYVSFKNGNVYTHDSSTYNTWYGKTYDTVIAFPHTEGGNTIKSYDTVAVEGDVPDRIHVRTEVPNVQSSDLVKADFKSLEGAWYAPLYRDRLSPNTGSTTPEVNLYTGDKIRGELAKFMLVYTQPTSIKQLKLFNINFDASRGQSI